MFSKLTFVTFVTFLCTLLSAQFSQAQEGRKLRIDPNKPIRLTYNSKAWNKNPNVAETGVLIFRDASSERIARIEVTETEMNSGVFVGAYSISWAQDKEIVPEIYVAPGSLKSGSVQSKNIEKMIDDGVLLRKPYFLRPEEKRLVAITIFDNRDQALKAYEEYRKTLGLINTPNKNVVDPSAIEAQEKARLNEALKAQAALAAKADAERQTLALQEAKKQEELKKAQEALSAAEKARRQNEAKKLATDAMELYKKEDYQGASAKFGKAVELDPENKNFYYQYGVTLYKTESYDRSLAILGLATGGDVNLVEKEYFEALNYMKLKEIDNAVTRFKNVRTKNDKVLSASASFLVGVIEFQTEKYDDSKKSFEFVLDNSSDPKLDEQAEAYIEQIANVKAFEVERSKKFIVNLNFGLMYDSNILAVSNSQIDAGTPTDLAGFRGTYGGSLEYRPVYTPNHEFSGVLSVNDMYSWDESFKAETNFQNTDPLTVSLGLPYKYKGQAFSKAYLLAITPSYETIMMNADGTGARENISKSTVLDIDQTFVMNENWFSNYSLELRSEDASLSKGTDEDTSATRISLMTTNTFFQDRKKTEAVIAEIGVSQNAADGKNQEYLRIDLGATYMAPWKWDTSWTARLGYYTSDYSNHSTGRKDDNTSLTLGLRKPLTESLTGMLTGNYTINKSTLASTDYKKYLIMTVFNWNRAF